MNAEIALAIIEASPDIAQNWAMVKEWVEFTPLGLLWKHPETEMPPLVYGTLCTGLGRAGDSVRYAIGDALLYGDRSADYAQFEDAFGFKPATLDQYRRVCKHIPMEERVKYIGVPWTALQITAHLDPETRDELIADYNDGAIESTTELRDEVQALKNGPDCSTLPPCPKCGGKLTSRKCKDCGLDFPAAAWWLVELLRKEADD